jgi:hypothetical protein
MSGNIRENLDGTLVTDQKTLQRQRATHGQVVDWEVFRDKPFFPSQATIETAQAAYRNVLSDVGCNIPELDNHDQRMVTETLNRTTSTQGHYTHKPGLIDRESDAGGFESLNIEPASRPQGWDTDGDGMPDWWEKAVGTNPQQADNNDDRDGDFYTNLEEYLNWMAAPHFTITGKTTVDLDAYFCGYAQPRFQVVDAPTGVVATIDDAKLTVEASAPFLFTVRVQASEAGTSLTRDFNFCVSGR